MSGPNFNINNEGQINQQNIGQSGGQAEAHATFGMPDPNTFEAFLEKLSDPPPELATLMQLDAETEPEPSVMEKVSGWLSAGAEKFAPIAQEALKDAPKLLETVAPKWVGVAKIIGGWVAKANEAE